MIQPPTAAQDFRQRVTLVRRDIPTTNELGESQPRWTAIQSVWAKVKPLSARELLLAAQNSLSVTHEVRLRYTPDLSHEDLIQFHGRLLDIVSIIDIAEQHVELVLLCNEQKD